jgi:flagellar protein FlaG
MSIELSGMNSQPQQPTASSRQPLESTPAATGAAQPVQTLNSSTQSVKQSALVEDAGLSEQKLQAAVEKMNELMRSSDRSLQFSVDDSTERMVIKVMDMETEEVIRQIPSEETLKFSEFLQGMVGLIFDQKA